MKQISIRSIAIALLIPCFAAFFIAAYYYQSRKALMNDLAQTGVVAIFDGGQVTQSDIRAYFQYPPVSESPLLRALELTPEDLSGLDQEDPAWLQDHSGQLLLNRIIKHIALMKHLNQSDGKTPDEAAQDECKAYMQSLMIDGLEKEHATLKPQITEEEMMNYYVRNRSEFHREGKRLARHMMIPVQPDDDASNPAVIWERLLEGDEFRSIILEESKSESSISDGLLGWQPRGALARSFENALWAMEIGEITGPIQVGDTLHFIQLLDEQPKGLMAFEECKPKIQRTLLTAKQAEQLFDQIGLAEEARRAPNPAETVEYRKALLEKAYELQWDKHADIEQKTNYFKEYKLADAAFQNKVNERLKRMSGKEEPESMWVVENATANKLFTVMDFHFLVHLAVSQEDQSV